jgi:hypothetical protein
MYTIQKHNHTSFPYYFDTTENSHNNMNMKIIVEVCISLVYWKTLIKIQQKIPCFVEIKSNSKIKFVVYQKQSLKFLLQNTYIYHYSKNRVFKNENPFLRTPIFGQSLSQHQHDSKPNKNSKFKPPMPND